MDIGMVLKIENKEAFNNLPDLLLTAMQWSNIGVMIARGDLAVELGIERISEVQEQILWVCEAAHVPVIWATQILENHARTGLATRAEITDASMSVRAECVMLNKGPNIMKTITTLSNILQRMEAHQNKKQGTLRQLSFANEFFCHDAERFR
jgi:pyruvate kinase